MERAKSAWDRTDERERRLALGSDLAEGSLLSGEAVIVVGGWMLLEEVQRCLKGWRGVVFTTRLAHKHRILQKWVHKPDEALLCTPSMLVEAYEIVGSVDRPLTVILLDERCRDKVARALELLKRVRSECTFVDIPAEEQTVWDAEISDRPSTFRLLHGGVSPQWSWLF